MDWCSTAINVIQSNCMPHEVAISHLSMLNVCMQANARQSQPVLPGVFSGAPKQMRNPLFGVDRHVDRPQRARTRQVSGTAVESGLLSSVMLQTICIV